MPPEPARSESWHLDKKVPISLIVVLVVQLVGFAMWLSTIESRVGQAVEVNAQQSTEIGNLRTASQTMAVSAATVAAQLEALRESLTELKGAQGETNDLLRTLITQKSAP